MLYEIVIKANKQFSRFFQSKNTPWTVFCGPACTIKNYNAITLTDPKQHSGSKKKISALKINAIALPYELYCVLARILPSENAKL